jgi:hypothetical protein
MDNTLLPSSQSRSLRYGKVASKVRSLILLHRILLDEKGERPLYFIRQSNPSTIGPSIFATYWAVMLQC